jgi:hypothetical protein
MAAIKPRESFRVLDNVVFVMLIVEIEGNKSISDLCGSYRIGGCCQFNLRLSWDRRGGAKRRVVAEFKNFSWL